MVIARAVFFFVKIVFSIGFIFNFPCGWIPSFPCNDSAVWKRPDLVIPGCTTMKLALFYLIRGTGWCSLNNGERALWSARCFLLRYLTSFMSNYGLIFKEKSTVVTWCFHVSLLHFFDLRVRLRKRIVFAYSICCKTMSCSVLCC